MEGCRVLDVKVGLKPGEKHCPYCLGYGGLPRPRFDPHCSYFDPPKCLPCDGTGKQDRLAA